MNNTNEQTFRAAMKELEKHIGDMEKRVVSCCGLTFTQCNTIMEIGRTGAISLNKLAELMEVDKSTMSLTISKLVKEKLVTRELDTCDRRYVSIVLTLEGQKVFETVQGGMTGHYAGLYASIPENKKSRIIDSLRILNSIFMKEKYCNK